MLALLEQPDTEISEIEEVLRYDPGLTANILKLANSAYFGIPSKIGSLKQAVMVLGFKRLIQLDQFEEISGEITEWADDLTDSLAFN